MDHKSAARQAVDHNRQALLALSHAVHDAPELAFAEHSASRSTAQLLTDNGFEVQFGTDKLATAFVARFGTGTLNIGICAEYDALPSIGHACGHNIIAAAAVGAGLALRQVADDLDLTVTVLGTPAEEGGGGKVLMLQDKMFDGLNAAMMVHAAPIERDAMATLAVSQVEVTYTGKAAHAAASPQAGVNAASALALAQAGIGMLREHILDTDRVHGIVTKGGDAPNIVPAEARGTWFIRSRTNAELEQLVPKMFDVFKGAALMMGCSVEIRTTAPSYAEVRTDEAMAALWRANAEALGRTSLPVQPGDGAASTDMGNVSYAMPTIHPFLAIDSGGANIHTTAFEQAAASPSGDQAVIDGAIGMAWTAIDMATDHTRARLCSTTFRVKDVPEADNAYLQYGFDTTAHFPD